MYAHCLYCSESLGRNETLGSFPVGTRLAFDAARGRLWVVCPRCERWCLSPLEERWEAIEEAERAFAGAVRRASTDHIGLARTADGTSLIRIGAPGRREFAAWRYGDQFGRRRKRQIGMTVGGAVVATGVIVGGPILGLWAAGAVNLISIATNLGTIAHQRLAIARVPTADSAEPLVVSRMQVRRARIVADREHGWALDLAHRGESHGMPTLRWDPNLGVRTPDAMTRLTGDTARRAAALLLPHLNPYAGGRAAVDAAVRVLEESPDPSAVFARAASNRLWHSFRVGQGRLEPGSIAALPTDLRLALEMVSHEESERRALEGELAELERAWQDAEEIAAISDNLLLPSPVQGALARLRGSSTRS